jgi:hypothetical protein
MAEMSQPFGKSFRDSLKVHSVKIVGLAAIGMATLVTGAMAETFNFSILTDLVTALTALIPDVNTLVSEGGPLVINVCVIAAICAPFIMLYNWAYKH